MIRGIASLYVMICHFLLPVVGDGSLLSLPLRFGQEAVMVFFMLSGFVVFYSTERQQPDFWTYLGRRWIRIYPVFLLSLFVCSLDAILSSPLNFPWNDLFGNLFMLQDFSYGKPGVWFPAFGGNSPLWSLAYEWWFYMFFFPIWRFVAPAFQQVVAITISVAGLVGYVMHPNQPCLYMMYFFLWWIGVEFGREYRAKGRLTFEGQRLSVGLLIGFLGLAGSLLLSRMHWSDGLGLGVYPLLQVRHVSACLMIALCSLFWQRTNWYGFSSCFGFFRHVAPISYGLYVLHYPIGVSGSFLMAISNSGLRLVIAVVVSLALAWIAEGPFQKLANGLFNRLFAKNKTIGQV